jgi:hypothetical protein
MPANLTTKLGQLVDVLTPDTTNTRIGVANASPTRTLDVTGTGGFTGLLTANGGVKVTTTSATTDSFTNIDTNTGGKEWRFGATTVSGGYFAFYNATDAVFGPKFSSTGLVGIGMTPSNVLDITQSQNANSVAMLLNNTAGTAAMANFYAKNSIGSVIRMGMHSGSFTTSGVDIADAGILYADGAGGLAIGTNTQPIRFYVGSTTEVARIDTSGRFLGGRTTAVTPSGTTIKGCFASGVSATNGTNSVCMGSNTITFDDSFLFVNNAAGTGVYLANGGTTWTANSDREMKHKIEALNAHDILRAVGNEAAKNGESIAVLYDWKENSDRREAGSIAQNWLAALPAIVEASNPKKLGLMYDRMGAIAAQGVYEQLAINAALEARLAALENK